MNKLGAYQKKARNLESVKARYGLLKEAALLPHKVTKVVARALQGQRAFCALSLSSSKIAPLTLNTYKARARELYSSLDEAEGDGFAMLESMRNAANLAVERFYEETSARSESFQKSPDGLLNLQRIQQLELHVVRQSKAFLDLYSKLNALVKEPGFDDLTRLRLYKILDSHQAMFADLVNPGSVRRDNSAVVVPMPERT